jgi:hypothetical protein
MPTPLARYARSIDGNFRRIGLRNFRRSIAKELDNVRSTGRSLVVSDKDDDIACVLPPLFLTLFTHITRSLGIDPDELTALRTEDEVRKFLYKRIVSVVTLDMNTFGSDNWNAIRDYFVDCVLEEHYPPQYASDLSQAQNIWAIGSNLRRVIPTYFKEFRQVLNRGGELHAVFTDPLDQAGSSIGGPDPLGGSVKSVPQAFAFSIMQEHGYYYNDEVKEFQKNLILKNRDSLLNLKQSSNTEKLYIYKMNYPLSFGIDVIDGLHDNGIIYVRYFPFADNGQPIVRLTRRNTHWYDFYLYQLERYKQISQPW